MGAEKGKRSRIEEAGERPASVAGERVRTDNVVIETRSKWAKNIKDAPD